MYLKFDEYIAMGGSLTEAAYNRLEFKAQKKIDRYTLDRLQAYETIPDNVKMAMYEIINILLECEENDEVKSVSHDGVSVSFADKKSTDEQIYDIVCEYLTPELLYRGVNV